MAALFYRQPLVTVLILLMIFMLPFSLFLVKYTIPVIGIKAESGSGAVSAGAAAGIVIKVSNPSPVPMLNCRLFFELKNSLRGGYDNEVVFAAEAGKTGEVKIPVLTEYSGMLIFDAKALEYRDFLDIFSITVPFKAYIEIPVLPRETLLKEEPMLKKMTVESDESVESAEGELTRDVRLVREYRPGDRLKDVHWKLSAKGDDILVKEYERNRDLYYMLLPELEYEYLETDLENLYALGRLLLSRKEPYRVALFSEEGLETVKVENTEELKVLLCRMFMVYAGIRPGVPSMIYEQFKRHFNDETAGLIRISRGRIISEGYREEY